MRLPDENDAAVWVQPWSITTSGAGTAGSRPGGAYTKIGRVRRPSWCPSRIRAPVVPLGSARGTPPASGAERPPDGDTGDAKPPRAGSGSRPSLAARVGAYTSRPAVVSTFCTILPHAPI